LIKPMATSSGLLAGCPAASACSLTSLATLSNASLPHDHDTARSSNHECSCCRSAHAAGTKKVLKKLARYVRWHDKERHYCGASCKLVALLQAGGNLHCPARLCMQHRGSRCYIAVRHPSNHAYLKMSNLTDIRKAGPLLQMNWVLLLSS
jgi:hypothetical protein